MLTDNDRLHDALDRVNAEAIRGPEGEIQYRNTVIMAGQVGNEAPIFMAMESLHRVIGDARRLEGEVLVTGLGLNPSETDPFQWRMPPEGEAWSSLPAQITENGSKATQISSVDVGERCNH